MTRKEYVEKMTARSLMMKEIDLTKVAVESIKDRIDTMDLPEEETNRAATKQRYLEEHIAELSHKKRLIDANIGAATIPGLYDD